jgi:hypothetical protein
VATPSRDEGAVVPLGARRAKLCDCWRNIPISLIDPGRPILNECNRLFSTVITRLWNAASFRRKVLL